MAAAAGLSISVIALAPPLIKASVRAWQTINAIRKTKKFAENPASWENLQKEILNWKILLENVNQLKLPKDKSTDLLLNLGKKHCEDYSATLDKVEEKIEDYRDSTTSADKWSVAGELETLQKTLRGARKKARYWLRDVNIFIQHNTNNQMQSQSKTLQRQSKSLNDISKLQYGNNVNNIQTRQLLLEIINVVKYPNRLKQASSTPDVVQLQLPASLDERLETLSEIAQGHLESTDSKFTRTTPVDMLRVLEDGGLPSMLDANTQTELETSSPEYSNRPTMMEALSNDPDSHIWDIFTSPSLCNCLEARGSRINNVGLDSATNGTLEAMMTRDTEAASKECEQIFSGSFYREIPNWLQPLQLYDEEDHFRDLIVRFAQLNIVSLGIALPEKVLECFANIFMKDAYSSLTAQTSFRRVSIVATPVSLVDSFRFRQNLASTHIKLLIHWIITTECTKEQVRHRLLDLKRLRQCLEQKRDQTLPKLTNMAVCITVPWNDYRSWAQGHSKNEALDTLWALGIVATIPLRVKLGEGRVQQQVWCPERIESQDILYPFDKRVHAYFQEYTYPDIPNIDNFLLGSIAPNQFIVVIFKTGSRKDWVEAVQSCLGMDGGREPYQCTSGDGALNFEYLERHYAQGL